MTAAATSSVTSYPLSTIASRKLGDFIQLNESPLIFRKAAQYCDFLGEVQYLVDSDSSLSYCSAIFNAASCTSFDVVDADSKRYSIQSFISKLKTAFGVSDAQIKIQYAYYDAKTLLRVIADSLPDGAVDMSLSLTGVTCTMKNAIMNSRVLINVASSSKAVSWIKVLIGVADQS